MLSENVPLWAEQMLWSGTWIQILDPSVTSSSSLTAELQFLIYKNGVRMPTLHDSFWIIHSVGEEYLHGCGLGLKIPAEYLTYI